MTPAEFDCVVPFTQTAKSVNPNLVSLPEAQALEAYFKSMAVSFASIRRWNPESRLRLITDRPVPNAVVFGLLRDIGVEISIVDFGHRPPPGFADSFAASLYLIDALAAQRSDTLYLDPDVICLSPFTSLVTPADRSRPMVLELGTEEGFSYNGASPQQCAELFEKFGGACKALHFGGELLYMPSGAAGGVADRSTSFLLEQFVRFEEGKSYLRTEEQILSCVLQEWSAQPFGVRASRVWTAHRYRDVSGVREENVVWHLPAEKDRGFATLFREVLNPGSWFWEADQEAFRERTARRVGVTHTWDRRLALDVAGRIANFWAQRRSSN